MTTRSRVTSCASCSDRPWLDVSEARNGSEALASIEEQPARRGDPRSADARHQWNGSILRRLRADPATENLPVLIYTSKVLDGGGAGAAASHWSATGRSQGRNFDTALGPAVSRLANQRGRLAGTLLPRNQWLKSCPPHSDRRRPGAKPVHTLPHPASRPDTSASRRAAAGGDGKSSAELPSLVILDVHLPDMSGFDICRQIKRDPRHRAYSVLQISASFVSGEDKAKSLEAGADGYLTHPIDGVVLVATVRSLLRLRAAEAMARESARAVAVHLRRSFGRAGSGECRQANWRASTQPLRELCGNDRSSVRRGRCLRMCCEELLGTDAPLRYLKARNVTTRNFCVGSRTIRATVGQSESEMATGHRHHPRSDRRHRHQAGGIRDADCGKTGGYRQAGPRHRARDQQSPGGAGQPDLSGFFRQADRDVHQFLEQANNEVARISRITKQSLSFHRDTQFAVPLDVGSLMEEVVALYGKLADDAPGSPGLRARPNPCYLRLSRPTEPGLRQPGSQCQLRQRPPEATFTCGFAQRTAPVATERW